jgi:hypothetical protein
MLGVYHASQPIARRLTLYGELAKHADQAGLQGPTTRRGA